MLPIDNVNNPVIIEQTDPIHCNYNGNSKLCIITIILVLCQLIHMNHKYWMMGIVYWMLLVNLDRLTTARSKFNDKFGGKYSLETCVGL